MEKELLITQGFLTTAENREEHQREFAKVQRDAVKSKKMGQKNLLIKTYFSSPVTHQLVVLFPVK